MNTTNTMNNSPLRRSDNSLSAEGLSESRKIVLSRIESLEKAGGESFFTDVEDDPPSGILHPDDVDYLNRKPKNRFLCACSRFLSLFYEVKIKRRFKISVVGAENLSDIRTGAVITSNHFSQYENMAVKCAVEKMPGHRRFYKVVREGNYFMPGIIGFLLKYCDTLPVSRDIHTMENFNRTVADVLARGDILLFYPEQAMWWNYRKPRPYKIGAFYFAAKHDVPVIPCFVTMTDGDEKDNDGALQQYYTIHVMQPLYPDKTLSERAAARKLMERNAALTKAKYEEVYKLPLSY